jgi:hypothetical protein
MNSTVYPNAPAPLANLLSLADQAAAPTTRRGPAPIPLDAGMLRNLALSGLTLAQSASVVGLSRRQLLTRLKQQPSLREAFTAGYRELRSLAVSALVRRLGVDPDDDAVLSLLTAGRGCRLSAEERAELQAARGSGGQGAPPSH